LTVTLPDQAGGSFTLTLPATESYLQVVSTQGLSLFCPNVVSAADVGPAGEVPTVLPNIVMQSYVTIFDLRNNRVGFAPQQGCQ
jgi:hypothetical protein